MADELNALTNIDIDAVEIGDRYRRLRGSMIDNVREALAIGERLFAKRQSFDHGEWLPWLEANAEVLGFGVRAANQMMRAAKDFKLEAASNLDDPTVLKKISRMMWGHNTEKKDHATATNRHERVATRAEIERVHLHTRIKELEEQVAELSDPHEPAEIRDLEEENEKLRSRLVPDFVREANESHPARVLQRALDVLLPEHLQQYATDERQAEAITSHINAARGPLIDLLDILRPEPRQKPKRKRTRSRSVTVTVEDITKEPSTVAVEVEQDDDPTKH